MNPHVFSGGEVLLGRYKVVRFLDEGGMQEVYLAEDLTFGRHVALKVPKNPSAKKRFSRSARMSARVTHANVAKTLDYFETDDSSFLIEEYIAGVDLKALLDTELSHLDPHLAAHVLHQLAKGCAAAHHVGVFHRDLKPSNVMVSQDANLGTVKITDFGIARLAEKEFSDALKNDDSITGSQTVLGALPYMAPEMILDQQNAGLPADIWALGAMLCTLLVGRPPFGTGLGAIPSILKAELPKKPKLFSQKPKFSPLSDELWALVGACLAKEPADRPTADQLVQKCGELCYSVATRAEGRISKFRFRPGDWGIIVRQDGMEVFFHLDSYFGDPPKVGDRVSFACFPGRPNSRAHPVLPKK